MVSAIIYNNNNNNNSKKMLVKIVKFIQLNN